MARQRGAQILIRHRASFRGRRSVSGNPQLATRCYPPAPSAGAWKREEHQRPERKEPQRRAGAGSEVHRIRKRTLAIPRLRPARLVNFIRVNVNSRHFWNCALSRPFRQDESLDSDVEYLPRLRRGYPNLVPWIRRWPPKTVPFLDAPNRSCPKRTFCLTLGLDDGAPESAVLIAPD
jgi:hypothetical protein